jgi:glyoxylase-like metal-dependent hydrolase (beta-lactamase superfamily II)
MLVERALAARVIDVGGVRIHALEAGIQRLDGGAMFGVVPKPLWEKRIEPDGRNRIPLAMRSVLLEFPADLVVVDTGAGNKESQKFKEINGIENEGQPTRLEDAIRAAGHSPADVTLVVNTHLHYDHAGGNTVRLEGGELRLAFPRARYVVQRREWEFAHLQNERVRASYFPDNFDPVADAGRFEFVDGPTELLPGLQLLPTPGHTPGHQSVLVGSGDAAVFFPADLAPTAAHLPLTWIMGYDVEPLVTLESKRVWLDRARREGWLLVFCHDSEVAIGRLDPSQDRPVLLA